MKSTRGEVDTLFMTVAQLMIVAAAIYIGLGIRDLTTDTQTIVEVHAARDASLLLETANAIEQDFTYVYPTSLPAREVSVIDNTIYVHSADTAQPLVTQSNVRYDFVRNELKSLPPTQRVDASYFVLTQEDSSISFVDGKEVITTALEEETLDLSNTQFSVSALEDDPRLEAMRSRMALGLQTYEGERTLRISLDVGDTTQVLYGSQELTKEVAQLIASKANKENDRVVAQPGNVEGIRIIIGSSMTQTDALFLAELTLTQLRELIA